jgi:hypothetical protein
MNEQNLFDFDGSTYEPRHDKIRLNAQLSRVFNAISDKQWHTPEALVERTGDEWASISARLRDLRKERFGGHKVGRRRKPGEERKGIFEYRLEV